MSSSPRNQPVSVLHRHGSRGPEFEHNFIFGLVETLAVVGRQELFNHDADPVQRVVDSAYFFTEGFFGHKAKNVTFRTVVDLDNTVWITLWKSCPRFPVGESHQLASQWAVKYVSPVAQRLRKLVPGANISVNDTRGALYACPFDLAVRDQSPWCNVFSARELQNLEYEYDLLMDKHQWPCI